MPALEGTVNVGAMPAHEVLRRLWNAATTGGNALILGHDRPLHIMTEEEAKSNILRYGLRYDWFQGRILKIDMRELPQLDVCLYDRDNGQGAAARALGLMP